MWFGEALTRLVIQAYLLWGNRPSNYWGHIIWIDMKVLRSWGIDCRLDIGHPSFLGEVVAWNVTWPRLDVIKFRSVAQLLSSMALWNTLPLSIFPRLLWPFFSEQSDVYLIKPVRNCFLWGAIAPGRTSHSLLMKLIVLLSSDRIPNKKRWLTKKAWLWFLCFDF